MSAPVANSRCGGRQLEQRHRIDAGNCSPGPIANRSCPRWPAPPAVFDGHLKEANLFLKEAQRTGQGAELRRSVSRFGSWPTSNCGQWPMPALASACPQPHASIR